MKNQLQTKETALKESQDNLQLQYQMNNLRGQNVVHLDRTYTALVCFFSTKAFTIRDDAMYTLATYMQETFLSFSKFCRKRTPEQTKYLKLVMKNIDIAVKHYRTPQ